MTIDLTGKRFGRLRVIKKSIWRHISKGGSPKLVWSCKCDCGRLVSVLGARLRNGDTKSCGCYRVDKAADTFRKCHTTHGGSYTKLYNIWHGMRKRCSSPNDRDFPRYGARGIKVCERWNDFANFRDDMGERPEGLVLDRINNDGNYEPSNCRWTDHVTSSRNRRSRWRNHVKIER